MLIEPPQLRDWSELKGELDCEPPVGLLYLASALREHGHRVEVLDCFQKGYDERRGFNGKVRIGLGDEEIAERIRAFKPEFVGISCIFFFNGTMARHICKVVKGVDRKITTIMGGIYPTVYSDEVIRDESVDVVVKNEGEVSIVEIVNKGIRSGIVHNPYVEDLDTLPFPARDLINIDDYQRKAFGMTSGRKFTTVLTSRGCPFKCSFCSAHKMWTRKTRFRSAENVLREISMLKELYDIREVHFIDENISLNKERFRKILKGLKELDVKWTTPNGIALFTLDEEDVGLMAESGCYSLAMAYESGNQEVLTNIVRKPLDLQKARRLTREVQRRGIKTRGFFIIGFPGETKEQILDTIRFANELELDMVGMNCLRPYPQTDVYVEAEKNGMIRGCKADDLTTKNAVISTREFSPFWIKSIIEADRFLALNRKRVKPFSVLFREIFSRNGMAAGLYVLALALRYGRRMGGFRPRRGQCRAREEVYLKRLLN